MLKLGVIADDFTGASDAASFLMQSGISTIMYSGIPPKIETSCAAAVIALKTRTEEVSKAVSASLEALRRLKEAGAQKIYVKYCSTFDSRPQGNIGPIVDAVMAELGASHTVLDPALPVNGRKVKDGILYVNGIPLAESPMANHPLTPMWSSSIAELMQEQGQHLTVHVPRDILDDPEKARRLIMQHQHASVYFVPDHEQDEDAEAIIRTFGDLPLLTGGSALVGAWAKGLQDQQEEPPCSGTNGGCILLAGSCSVATRSQIEHWKRSGGHALRLEPEMALDPQKAAAHLLDQIGDQPCLVYSSDSPDQVAAVQAAHPDIDRRIEETLSLLAVQASAKGIQRWIVAGGETSGAVTKALGYQAFLIGESIAPGVPVMIPLDAPEQRLILKSGNFGQKDFFTKAVERTKKK